MKYLGLLLLLSSLPSVYAQKIKSLIEKGNLAGIEKMHEKGEDVFSYFDLYYYHESDGEEGWETMMPMSYAVAKGQDEILDFYIAHKDVSWELEWWDFALAQSFIVALSKKDEVTLAKLYALNPSLDFLCASCRDHNAIMVAAAYSLEDWYFKLKPLSDLGLTSTSGNTLLHIASRGESHGIFDDVLGSGNYDINQKNGEGFSPLDMAAMAGNYDFFHHLIEAGADIEMANMIWISAAISGNTEIYAYVDQYAPLSSLYHADDWGSFALDIALQENNEAVALAIIKTSARYAEIYSEGNGKSYDFIDNYLFSNAETDPLEWPVYNNNRTLFEACIAFAAEVNSTMQDTYIPITAAMTKRASKTFGKAFVTEVYARYQVVAE